MITSRRTFLTGLIAAPIVITTPGLLMPIKMPVNTLRPKRVFLYESERHEFFYFSDLQAIKDGSLKIVYLPDQWRARSTLDRQSR